MVHQRIKMNRKWFNFLKLSQIACCASIPIASLSGHYVIAAFLSVVVIIGLFADLI